MERFLRRLVAMLVLGLMFASGAHAQATRTWVSGVGDDANPCSRTAPCKTFAGAISKTATGGEINVLDPGGFGAVTITKAITISGGGELASVLVSGTNGIVVSAGPADMVIFRNIEINGIGTGINGIRVLSAGTVMVDHCQIYGFTGNAIDVSVTNPVKILVQDSTFSGTGGSSGGVVLEGTSGPGPVTALLKNVSIQGTGTAVHTYRGHIDVIRSTFQGNAYGALAELGSINIDDSMFSYNGTALQAMPTASVRMSNLDIFNNDVGIGSGGGTVLSAGNNRKLDNTTPGNPTGTYLMQ